MNIFFKINDKLITAPTNDRILDGITRKSVIQIANDLGIDVEIRPVKVSEIIEAAENKSLKEVFGSGTAVVVSSIKSFGYRGKNYKLPKVDNPLAANLKEKITAIQYNLIDDPGLKDVIKEHRNKIPNENHKILGRGSLGHESYNFSEKLNLN